MYFRKLKCKAPVRVVVKVDNRIIFGVIGAGLGSYRSSRMRPAAGPLAHSARRRCSWSSCAQSVNSSLTAFYPLPRVPCAPSACFATNKTACCSGPGIKWRTANISWLDLSYPTWRCSRNSCEEAVAPNVVMLSLACPWIVWKIPGRAMLSVKQDVFVPVSKLVEVRTTEWLCTPQCA